MVSGYITVRNILWLSVCLNLSLTGVVFYSRYYGQHQHGSEEAMAQYEALMSRFLVVNEHENGIIAENCPPLPAKKDESLIQEKVQVPEKTELVVESTNAIVPATIIPSEKSTSLQMRTSKKVKRFQQDEKANKVHMFIAIGSKGSLLARRQEIRRTWLNWLPKDGSVQYMFFTDHGNDPITIANKSKKGR